MDWTLFACRLILAELAPAKPYMSIFNQFAVLVRELRNSKLTPAIKPYHPLYNTFLTFNSVHTYKDSTNEREI